MQAVAATTSRPAGSGVAKFYISRLVVPRQDATDNGSLHATTNPEPKWNTLPTAGCVNRRYPPPAILVALRLSFGN
ncbi:MAG TPA: hypothetical protein VF447_08835, partial [Terriglobales bacterium]